ncbi:MAG: hypothetical protein WB820_20065 [Rhodoplanes sp.]
MVAAVPPKVLDGIIAGAPIGRLATPRKSRAASPFWWPMAQGSSPGRPYRPMGGKIWHDLSRTRFSPCKVSAPKGFSAHGASRLPRPPT